MVGEPNGQNSGEMGRQLSLPRPLRALARSWVGTRATWLPLSTGSLASRALSKKGDGPIVQ